METNKQFRVDMEHALDEHFPKGKSADRSRGLMLFASAVLLHSKIMRSVKEHFSYLLSETREQNLTNPKYKRALDFYHSIDE